MVMLDAARESSSGLIVATFDHRTGPAAADAVRLVQRRARELDHAEDFRHLPYIASLE